MTLLEPFTLNTSPVFAELMPRSQSERRAAYADPAWRQRVREGWAAGQGIPPRWDTYSVMESTANADLVGTPLLDIAARTGADPLDVLLDLALAEADFRHLRVRAVLANDDVDGVATLLTQDGCTLGLSDAGAHVGQLCDAPLATDLLGNWVRGRGVLSLEQAVHKLTKVQADLFGFAGRGVLAPGAHADVVVFDPDTVAPGPLRRVRDFPAGAERLTADQPTGMRHLLVNGVALQVDGSFSEAALASKPGALVKPAPR
jgi:N-acyl-D-aspartate/D-glutamate deacylase